MSTLPDIGWPIGVLYYELEGAFIREKYKRGKLVGWHGRNKEHPVVEFPDGTYQVVESLKQTDWKR